MEGAGLKKYQYGTIDDKKWKKWSTLIHIKFNKYLKRDKKEY
jgi:hypothetical protein